VSKYKDHKGGNLRRILLDAALDILGEDDTPLDLRKVAERAGKSRTAPYIIFGKEREGGGLTALRLAVATEGTKMLLAALRAGKDPTSDPRAGLEQLVETFLTFATHHERLFRLMFGPEMVDLTALRSAQENDHPELKDLANARLDVEKFLQQIIIRCQEDRLLPQGHPIRPTLRAWIAIHGTAVLMLDPLIRLKVRTPVTEATQMAMEAILGEDATGSWARPRTNS